MKSKAVIQSGTSPQSLPAPPSPSGDGGQHLVVEGPPDLGLVPLHRHVERAGQVRQDLPPLLGQVTLGAQGRNHPGVSIEF